ncbi:hypothetical protein N9D38_08520 [Rubripirellula sp.]|nr:hypothetical protein [Rubripirellula sp.]
MPLDRLATCSAGTNSSPWLNPIKTHYLQTTEADFDLAGDLPGDLFGVPSQGRQDPPRAVTKRKNPGKTGAMVFPDGSGGSIEYTPEDSNL